MMAIVKDRGNPQSIAEPHIFTPGQFDDKPWQGAQQMTVGATIYKGRGISIYATTAGNVTIQLQDGSIQVVPVGANTSTFIPGGVGIPASTATATYYMEK